MNINREVNRIKNGSNKPRLGKLLRSAPIPIALILVIMLVLRVSANKKETASQASNTSPRVAGALAITNINKQFELPIIDKSGEDLGALKFEIISAEKRKEIFVKGKKATAVEGREFLILNIKIVNELNRSVDVNSRNYLRLSVNGNEEEWLAPDIHNDPVEVQAISTKLGRVGFPINTTDSILMLQIGEISSNKEKVLLEF